MYLLLDTHVAIWSLTGDKRLTAPARALISASNSEVFVSAVSIWEIAIKRGAAREAPTDMPMSSGEALRLFNEAGFTVLPITAQLTTGVEQLPRHHNDPFDRLLIAQAMAIPAKLLTYDAALQRYSELVILV